MASQRVAALAAHGLLTPVDPDTNPPTGTLFIIPKNAF